MLKDDLRKQEEAATAARQEAANFQAERDIERQKAERREADLARADEWRKSLDEREMRQQAGAGWLCRPLGRGAVCLGSSNYKYNSSDEWYFRREVAARNTIKQMAAGCACSASRISHAGAAA